MEEQAEEKRPEGEEGLPPPQPEAKLGEKREGEATGEQQAPGGKKMLLKAYKWHTWRKSGFGKGESAGSEKQLSSPGPLDSAWTKLQSWRKARQPLHKAQSEPAASDQQPTTSAEDQPPPPSPPPPDSKGGFRRSTFKRALSAPIPSPKKSKAGEPPGSGKVPSGGAERTIFFRNYFRSVSQRLSTKRGSAKGERSQEPLPRIKDEKVAPVKQISLSPSPGVPVWDIGNFTLIDGQLMLTSRDVEVYYWTRNRASSCLSDTDIQILSHSRSDLGKYSKFTSSVQLVSTVKPHYKALCYKATSVIKLVWLCSQSSSFPLDYVTKDPCCNIHLAMTLSSPSHPALTSP
ncbi:uncharacterized protein LOC135357727 [Latimeria chalumnae]|uniref:uncharacterized protein LOC135357727 n=1 Tax=Latimeria chalumnae TaxID=7897 RepID=UPI00313D412F